MGNIFLPMSPSSHSSRDRWSDGSYHILPYDRLTASDAVGKKPRERQPVITVTVVNVVADEHRQMDLIGFSISRSLTLIVRISISICISTKLKKREFDEKNAVNFRELPLLEDSWNESVGKSSHT